MTALLLAVIPIVLTAFRRPNRRYPYRPAPQGHSREPRPAGPAPGRAPELGRLPAAHPNRAALEAKNGELVGVLACRQQRRHGPFTPAGVSFGVCTGVAIVALVFAGFSALLATRVIPSTAASDPPTTGDQWAAAVVFLVMAAGFAMAGVMAARRQLRQHPTPAHQPAEAG